MLNLGPVSAHVADSLTHEAHRHGMLVWLDLAGHYTDLATTLADAHAQKLYPVPMVPFTGSFLDLMLKVQPLGGGLSQSPAILYMPGFNEQAIRTTPALEMYQAGRRARRKLETMIREAAVGQVTPAVLSHFLECKDLTLAAADAWLETAAAQASGELGAFLETSEPTTVLAALLDRTQPIGRRLALPESRLQLQGWFERRMGVDAAWRSFANRIDDVREHDRAHRGSRTTSLAHLAPITHALCAEYVSDLHRPPFAPALQSLADLDPTLLQANLAVAQWLRDEHPQRYEQIANDVEGLIAVEVGGKPEDLGAIDTFRFEEAGLMKAALAALESEEWSKALGWAEGREDRASFWANKSNWRKTAWRLIAAGARLGAALAEAQPMLSDAWYGQESALNAYSSLGESGGWRVDQAHRKLESERATRWDARIPHYTTLQERLDELRNKYRTWADELARKYAAVCETHGFLPDAGKRQRSLFRDTVKQLLIKHPKQSVAYFMVDALRYEMATTLLEQLGAERGVDATLTARLAEAPTDTWLCMNTLALDQDGDQPIQVHSGGVRAGAYVIRDPQTRRRAMREAAGLKKVVGLSVDEALDCSAEVLERKIRQTRLVVVHSLEIDKAGENGQGLQTYERALSRLRSAFQRLRMAGIQHFVFTADHGFLLHDEPNLLRIAFGDKKYPSRRSAQHPEPTRQPNLVVVQPRHLGLEGMGDALVFPRSTAVFDRGRTCDDFAHGGLSLQERVIPVLKVLHRNPKGRSTLRYSLQITPLSNLMGMCRVQGVLTVQAAGQLSFGGDDHVELALRVPERSDVDIDLLECEDGEIQGNLIRATVGKRFTVYLKLSAAREEKVRLELFDPTSASRVPAQRAEAWFDVLKRKPRVDAERDATPVQPEQPATVSDDWASVYDNAGVRMIFEHLHAHGSITEAECIGMLGNARTFRRFSRNFEKHAAKAPFDLRVEVAATGKRYVREGEN